MPFGIPPGPPMEEEPLAFSNFINFPKPKQLSLGVSEPIKDLLRKASNKSKEAPCDTGSLTQMMQLGDVPCSWSAEPVWEKAQLEVQNFVDSRMRHQDKIAGLQQRQEDHKLKLHRLQDQIQALRKEETQLMAVIEAGKKEIQEETQQMEEDSEWNGENMLAFVQAAARAEAKLVETLEKQLAVAKTLPSSANKDQPTLSTLLNCFRIATDTIVLVNLMQMDSDEFLVCTRNDFFRAGCREPHLFDVLYCQEMLGNAPFPFSEHDDFCTVCACRTPMELVCFLKERGIVLDYDFLKDNNINGPRLLCLDADLDFTASQPKSNDLSFSFGSGRPSQPAPVRDVAAISKALRQVRSIHKLAFKEHSSCSV